MTFESLRHKVMLNKISSADISALSDDDIFTIVIGLLDHRAENQIKWRDEQDIIVMQREACPETDNKQVTIRQQFTIDIDRRECSIEIGEYDPSIVKINFTMPIDYYIVGAPDDPEPGRQYTDIFKFVYNIKTMSLAQYKHIIDDELFNENYGHHLEEILTKAFNINEKYDK